jgi:hypothetical protein
MLRARRALRGPTRAGRARKKNRAFEKPKLPGVIRDRLEAGDRTGAVRKRRGRRKTEASPDLNGLGRIAEVSDLSVLVPKRLTTSLNVGFVVALCGRLINGSGGAREKENADHYCRNSHSHHRERRPSTSYAGGASPRCTEKLRASISATATPATIGATSHPCCRRDVAAEDNSYLRARRGADPIVEELRAFVVDDLRSERWHSISIRGLYSEGDEGGFWLSRR